MKWIAPVIAAIGCFAIAQEFGDGVAPGANTLRIEATGRVGRKIENEYFDLDPPNCTTSS